MSAVSEIRLYATPRYRVTISREARDAIEEELYRFQHQLREKYETGGLLFGTVDGVHTDGAHIDVTMATGPGPDFEPEINGMKALSAESVLGTEQARIVGDMVIGSWHAHPKPGLLRAADPSPEDLSHWSGLLSRTREDMAVGLIAVEGHMGGWRSPRLFGWAVISGHRETWCESLGEIHR